MTKVRHPRALAAAGLLAAAALLSACGGSNGAVPEAGSAAIIGDGRITEVQLADQVQAVLAAQQQPVDTPNATLTSRTLSRMITIDLVNRLSAKEGIVVTQGDIDEQLAGYDQQAGGREQVLKVFAEQGVAPDQIQDMVKLNIQAQQLGIKLDPHGSAEQQGAAVVNAVTALSNELGVTTSPRYGTWDAVALQIGPGENDLSAPPALAK